MIQEQQDTDTYKTRKLPVPKEITVLSRIAGINLFSRRQSADMKKKCGIKNISCANMFCLTDF